MTAAWIENGVREFGRQAGIKELRTSASGTLGLKLESGAQFFLEMLHAPEGEFALLYLVRPVGHGLGPALRRALRQAHHAAGGPCMPLVGSTGSGSEAQLVAGIRQTEGQFNAQPLGQALDFLIRWTDEACGAPLR